MNTKGKIAVIGGDARMAFCASGLGRAGYEVAVYAPAPGLEKLFGAEAPFTRALTLSDALGGANCVVTGIPALRGGININTSGSVEVTADGLLSGLAPGSAFIGGKIPDPFRRRAEMRGIDLYDYAENERLAVLNSVPTAEGAIAVAIREMSGTLWHSRSLVIGCGRIGRTLADRLVSLGSDVTVAARRDTLVAECECFGCTGIGMEDIAAVVGSFDVVFNTVPARILGDNELKAVSSGTPVIDLASEPGGADTGAAEAYGVRLVRAPGLPGKTAPAAAGAFIAEAVLGYLKRSHT